MTEPGSIRPSKTRTKALILGLLLLMLTVALTACGGSGGDSGADSLGAASPFELGDQFGNIYEFTPGDGKDRVFVFYMGYF